MTDEGLGSAAYLFHGTGFVQHVECDIIYYILLFMTFQKLLISLILFMFLH